MLVVLAMEGRPPMVETVGLTIVLEVAVEVLAAAPTGMAAGTGAIGAATACGAEGGILGGGPPEVVTATLPPSVAAKLGGTTGPWGLLGGI